MKDKIEQELREVLDLERSPLLGCPRRNAWVPEPAWRDSRGNALLQLVGKKSRVFLDEGPHEFFSKGNFLLAFRGGDWQHYWNQGLIDEWAVIRSAWPQLSNTVIILHERHGELDVRLLPIEEGYDWHERLTYLRERASGDPPGRISKAGARAFRVCVHCPVKRECDATDKLHHDDKDWHPRYPLP